jgi:RNA polymerase sigma-70 factor (ECF subfamily)
MASLSSTAGALDRTALAASAGKSLPPGLEPPRVEAGEMSVYAADLKRRALGLTRGDASRASDLVQDTFERALGNLHRVIPGSNIRAWLYTIMIRRFQDILRQDRVRRAASFDDELEVPAQEVEPPPAWSAVTSDQVRAALVLLNPELRVVFERREFGQLSYHQIADELRIPVATVGTRLLRARQQLRDILIARLEQSGAGACK